MKENFLHLIFDETKVGTCSPQKRVGLLFDERFNFNDITKLR